MQLLATFASIAATIIVLDLLWLGVIMKDFYRAQIGHLMSGTVVWGAAILFYLVYAAGVWFFAVASASSLVKALTLGALLGALAYATYDLTNQATLKDWPLVVTVADIAWGAFITGVAATVGYAVTKLFS